MKRLGALTIAVAMTVAACGGSDETVAEPDVEVEAVDEDGPMRLAGNDVQVINGCRIEPNTRCTEVDLSGSNLRDVNMAGARLMYSNLTGVDLSGSNLREANLIGVDLSGSNLRDVNLSGVTLWVVVLVNANLMGANLSGANLREASLLGASFCNTIMPDDTVRNDNC